MMALDEYNGDNTCPSCNLSNELYYSYCSFCGSKLNISEKVYASKNIPKLSSLQLNWLHKHLGKYDKNWYCENDTIIPITFGQFKHEKEITHVPIKLQTKYTDKWINLKSFKHLPKGEIIYMDNDELHIDEDEDEDELFIWRHPDENDYSYEQRLKLLDKFKKVDKLEKELFVYDRDKFFIWAHSNIAIHEFVTDEMRAEWKIKSKNWNTRNTSKKFGL